MQTEIAKMIYQKAEPLPQALAEEVLDFIDFIASKHQHHCQDLILAQSPSLSRIWDNPADEVWNSF